jgi:HK97 gp10 family phage protein
MKIRTKMQASGLNELTAVLEKRARKQDIAKVVKFNTAKLHEKTERNASHFKGHYEWNKAEHAYVFTHGQGNLKRAIFLRLEDGGMTGIVQPTANYSCYVEMGTRYMAAQPYLRPAFLEQKEKFLRDLKKLTGDK